MALEPRINVCEEMACARFSECVDCTNVSVNLSVPVCITHQWTRWPWGWWCRWGGGESRTPPSRQPPCVLRCCRPAEKRQRLMRGDKHREEWDQWRLWNFVWWSWKAGWIVCRVATCNTHKPLVSVCYSVLLLRDPSLLCTQMSCTIEASLQCKHTN